MVLKRKLGPESWPLEAVVGVGWRRRGSGSLGVASWLQFREKIRAIWASNQPPKRPRFPPRLTTISARSGFDRASIVLLKLHRSASARAGSIPRHNVCDRGSIAPRSRLDRAAIAARSRGSSSSFPHRPMVIRRSWLRIIAAVRCISRLWFDDDPPLLGLPRGVLRAFRSTSLKWVIAHVVDWWSRGLGSTRS